MTEPPRHRPKIPPNEAEEKKFSERRRHGNKCKRRKRCLCPRHGYDNKYIKRGNKIREKRKPSFSKGKWKKRLGKEKKKMEDNSISILRHFGFVCDIIDLYALRFDIVKRIGALWQAIAFTGERGSIILKTSNRNKISILRHLFIILIFGSYFDDLECN